MPALPAPPPPSAALVTLRPGAPAGLLGPGAERLWPGARTFRLRLPAGAGPTALRGLRALPGVAAAEPDRALRAAATTANTTLASQPYLTQIGWTPGPASGATQLVAVLDTGVDPAAPGLEGRVDVAAARSFVGGDPLRDGEGHGTHVAGLVATVSGTAGGRGLARVLPVKIADHTGEATTSSLVRGIRYAVSRSARIINVSFGGAGSSPLEQDAIDDAVRAGALVVTAAGNSGGAGSPREYPGAYRQVLAVGAVDPGGRPIPTSTRGPQVALAAPGLNLLSSAPEALGEYATRTGTSMAAAVVSGVAARVAAARPGLDASQVRQALVASTGTRGGGGTQDLAMGAGVVNMRRALAGPAPRADRPEPDDDPVLAARLDDPLLDAGEATATVRGRVRPVSDPRDDGVVRLEAGETVTARLSGGGGDADLVLWRPGTPAFRAGPAFARRWTATAAVAAGPAETLVYTAPESGDYGLEVRSVRGAVEYRLTVQRG